MEILSKQIYKKLKTIINTFEGLSSESKLSCCYDRGALSIFISQNGDSIKNCSVKLIFKTYHGNEFPPSMHLVIYAADGSGAEKFSHNLCSFLKEKTNKLLNIVEPLYTAEKEQYSGNFDGIKITNHLTYISFDIVLLVLTFLPLFVAANKNTRYWLLKKDVSIPCHIRQDPCLHSCNNSALRNKNSEI